MNWERLVGLALVVGVVVLGIEVGCQPEPPGPAGYETFVRYATYHPPQSFGARATWELYGANQRAYIVSADAYLSVAPMDSIFADGNGFTVRRAR